MMISSKQFSFELNRYHFITKRRNCKKFVRFLTGSFNFCQFVKKPCGRGMKNGHFSEWFM